MLNVDEALELVLRHTGQPAPARVPLAKALGLVLAEDIAADIDSPPHDKSIVDGYAVVAADLSGGTAELAVLEEITAGALPTKTVTAGQCSRIMTGAPLPSGADAVVMIERTELLSDHVHVQIREQAKPGQNIMRRGASMRAGEVVLRAGHEIRPAEIGLLAEIGRAEVPVFPPCRVAILATGNELVDVSDRPAAGQIRNSNGPMLAAAVRRAVAMPARIRCRPRRADRSSRQDRTRSDGRRARDLRRRLGRRARSRPCRAPRLGRRASVPQGEPETRQAACGSERVNLERLSSALPGNPVSSLVCFELFVRPAIAKLSGRDPSTGLRQLPARLASEFVHRGERPTYFPAIVRRQQEAFVAEPVRWRGSADLRGVAEANALAMFPAGDRVWQAGEAIDVLLL